MCVGRPGEELALETRVLRRKVVLKCIRKRAEDDWSCLAHQDTSTGLLWSHSKENSGCRKCGKFLDLLRASKLLHGVGWLVAWLV